MMMKMPQIVSKQYIAQTRTVFHCQCKIKIPLDYGEALLDECFEILEKIDQKYNSYQAGSYFDKINKNHGHWVEVDQECTAMLQMVKLISQITNGSYDITCMPLLRMWGFYRQNNQAIPSGSEIEEALQKVDCRFIEIAKNHVRIGDGQEIITGSFLKAFAVDKALAFLKSRGVSDAIINAGGSTISAINDDSHSSWKVNIPDAFVENNYVGTAKISNQTFSLSGTLNNHLIVNGKKYSHILDSKTGMPVTTAQVGVITNEAFLGDVLSTALFTVSPVTLHRVAENLKKHFDFEYFRIEENGTKTSGICF